MFFLQFKLDIVSVVFVDIEDDEPLGMMLGDLPAKLGADRAAPSFTLRDKKIDHTVQK